MAREYNCLLPSVARTVQFDAFEVTPADDKPVTIHDIDIGQSTETGDAAEEMITIEIIRGGTGMTSGSGGTGSVAAQVPVPLDSIDTPAGATYDAGNETVATFTAGLTVFRTTFNLRQGFQKTWAPEDRIKCSQSNGGIVVRLSAPADSVTWVGTLTIAEEP